MCSVCHQSKYDLPSCYNDNSITLLARDPHWLYAYWEISDERRDFFFKDLGHELWEKSVPVLKITNVSKNENTFVRINDFCSSWYINVPDTNCLYTAEIGRRVSERFFINLASSNYAATPCNNISVNNTMLFVNYVDFKNKQQNSKTVEIYESCDLKLHFNDAFGISSIELSGTDFCESFSSFSYAERMV